MGLKPNLPIVATSHDVTSYWFYFYQSSNCCSFFSGIRMRSKEDGRTTCVHRILQKFDM